MNQPTYHHTQKAPLCLLLYSFAVYLFGLALFGGIDDTLSAYLISGGGLLLVVLAAAFHHLTVEDEVDELAIRFGPLSLFQKRMRYDEMLDVEVGRTTILDGWGIHLSLRGGWVWNIWGRDCVVIRSRRGTVRVGTDEPHVLAEFLQSRIK